MDITSLFNVNRRKNPCQNCKSTKIIVTTWYDSYKKTTLYECQCLQCHLTGRPAISEKDAIIIWNLFNK